VTTLLFLVLALLALSGLVTVIIRDPVRQAIALGVFGLLEALMFFVVQAPDVALSEIVVSGIALPAMLFLAMAKIRSQQEAREEEADEE
jgi:energy-converting hydrogenase B subunit D